MGTYNWGDGALLTFHEKVKDALDPNVDHRAGQVRRLAPEVPRPGPLRTARAPLTRGPRPLHAQLWSGSYLTIGHFA